MQNCELLSPCGSIESVYAALNCGADAIYIGLKSFSARQNAVNFDYSELDGVISLCHLFGSKVYVAVNTIVFENKFDELIDCIKICAKSGIDAFIVQDLGVLRLIQRVAPSVPVHASTQLTVHTPQGARNAQKLGFKRVVVSRELNCEEISQICKTGIEVEVFVHGALCMSVSGQCYMSAVIGSRSANRGLCAQPCRLPFYAASKEDHALSLKDLSLIGHISKLKEIGVKSFKIEGRMKRPEYVAAATLAYRNAIDSKPYDTKNLDAVFSREGFTDGYFKNKLGKNMFGIRKYENVLETSSVLSDIRKSYNDCPKIYDIDFFVGVTENIFTLKAKVGDIYCEESLDISQYCEMRPLDDKAIEKQLSKLGNTVFKLKSVSFEAENSAPKMPISVLNGLRRAVTEKISGEIINVNTSKYEVFDCKLPKKALPLNNRMPRIRAEFNNAFQFLNLPQSINEKIELVQLPLCEIEKNTEELLQYRDRIIISPPRFLKNEESIFRRIEVLFEKGFSHLYCSNIAYFAFAEKLSLHGGFGLNIANDSSVEQLSDLGFQDAEISFELKLSMAKRLLQNLPLGVIAYGRLPLMLNLNCPIKDCQNCKGRIFDRKHSEFYVKCPKTNEGYAEILNCHNLEMSDKIDELCGFDFIKLIFFDESPQLCAQIIERYIMAEKPNDEFTRGLYYRGVQ